MSRKNSEGKASVSPAQRRACIVVACCVLAVVVTFVLSWFVLPKFFGGDGYDPDLYPLDTSLSAVLTSSTTGDENYVNDTVFIGDQYTVSMYTSGLITLDQYVGAEGLSIANALKETCVYFVDDSTAYTITQALAKMKPRRVVVTLGSNDVSGSLAVDMFIQDYKQFLKGVAAAYPYCDIIVNTIPPVASGTSGAAATQETIDQFNQQIAQMCEDEGYKLLNTAETLKDATGYANDSYLNGDKDAFAKTGVSEVLAYLRSHAYETDDRRPDTEDIPKRAASASGSASSEATATPTATPTQHTVSYKVEDSAQGTLTGNDQSGVSSLEFQVDDRATVKVTAEAADGYVFYKWSDGQTSATRVDTVTKDISVTAMFNDARVELTLDQGDMTVEAGSTVTVNAKVKLGDKDYDSNGVQWSLNDEMLETGSGQQITLPSAGSYVLKAGIEINGTYASQSITITVTAPPTTISISGTSSLKSGESTTLTASGDNFSGDTTWTCDQVDWTATGDQVQFTAPSVNTAINCIVRATNNGQSAEFTIRVEPAPTATPTQQPDDHDD